LAEVVVYPAAMDYTNLHVLRTLFFATGLASLAALSACGGGTSAEDAGPTMDANAADAARADGGASDGGVSDGGLDASDALCVVDCPKPPRGCRYEPVPGECSCGALICDDAGVGPGGDAGSSCATNVDCAPREHCAGMGCDTPGVCEPRPTACPEIYSPVCGCDGNDYDNSCSAAAAGVRVASIGICASMGGCRSNDDCGPRAYCEGMGCGTEGTCQPRPDVCPDIFMPVCGCDGVTYSNACDAAASGARVSSRGECGMAERCSPPCAPGERCALCRGGAYVCLGPGLEC
jgi:hypothetical protein